jgi:hypothetical protein
VKITDTSMHGEFEFFDLDWPECRAAWNPDSVLTVPYGALQPAAQDLPLPAERWLQNAKRPGQFSSPCQKKYSTRSRRSGPPCHTKAAAGVSATGLGVFCRRIPPFCVDDKA